jgi:hypothetical protein
VADTFAHAIVGILDLIEERSQTGPPEARDALRGILREVAPDRLLAPQPPVGAVLEHDSPNGKRLIVRFRSGYRQIVLNGPGAGLGPELSWRHVSKFPGLTRLVPDTTAAP